MRSSARIPSVLASLALAVGGITVAAPAAHADMKACEQYVADHKGQVTDDVRQACYEGQIGNQTSCSASLTEAGLSKDVAAGACRVAPQ
ncbi:hypothetical protein OG756_40195 [Streptomyces sp. NBC_01310]|uniref:hypothetical protein n=1 Tax=Streptomyces sp. NBC_01310 TaxID=2903820 RepID=UPI0035B5FA97|nr:hypothetical protein OG756_40195 [Streptomyces sp. NBC_01310]